MDTKRMRDAANEQLTRVGMRTEDLVRWRQETHPEKVLALLDENDSLRAEVERLRKDAQAARLETITALGEAAELERQLSAALAAKDEACEIATKLVAPVIEAYAAGPSDRVLVEWSGPVTVEGGKPFETLARVTELRSIGKDGGNG